MINCVLSRPKSDRITDSTTLYKHLNLTSCNYEDTLMASSFILDRDFGPNICQKALSNQNLTFVA